MRSMMAQKNLHELLKEDQEPFQLKSYIYDKRCQLKRLNNVHSTSKTSLQVKKQKPINTQTSTSASNSIFKHACFLSFQDSPDVRKSPLYLPSPAAAKSPCRTQNGTVFLHVPSKTATLLLEAAMRIQKQQNPKPKTQINKVGFGLFGSILKRLKDNRNGNKKRELKNGENRVKVSTKTACSCNNSILSSTGWSESNEEKSIDLETSSSSCRSTDESLKIEVFNGDYGSSPLSPFRFSLKTSPSSGDRTPEFSSPAASPIRHKNEDKDKYETIALANIEEEDEKDQCSPVSVLDPPFEDDDDGHEGGDEEEDGDDDDDHLECSYAIVQRAQQQLLCKLRRFEKLAELDPIELEKILLEEEDNDDLAEEEDYQDNDSLVSSHRDRDFDTCASELMIPFDMKSLISDLISVNKTETKSLDNGDGDSGRIRDRLYSWQGMRSNAINTMVESDLRTEFDDWKKFEDQREEFAIEVEISIFGSLVEELGDELVHLIGHHEKYNKVLA